MKYNPDIHHRRSIRLKGYDYSQAGRYFITICTQKGLKLFGNIENEKMELNECGRIAEECLCAIPEHFPQAILHEFVVMPNHIHFIVEITEMENSAGADSVGVDGVRTDGVRMGDVRADDVGANNYSPLPSPSKISPPPSKQQITPNSQQSQQIHGTSKTVGSIVRGFKIGVTKWFRDNTDIYTVWQRDYYEHIIRDEKSYNQITEYIQTNPERWQEDRYFC